MGNLWEVRRTEGGRNLAHYYLVYFLLVELLRFFNFGRSEKIAWSIPIGFEGTTYLVDHRKFGVGCSVNALMNTKTGPSKSFR